MSTLHVVHNRLGSRDKYRILTCRYAKQGKRTSSSCLAVLHVLFSDGIDDKGELTVHEVPTVVESKAVVAARNFVNTCCQHAAFVAGRGLIDDKITQLTSSKPQTLLD